MSVKSMQRVATLAFATVASSANRAWSTARTHAHIIVTWPAGHVASLANHVAAASNRVTAVVKRTVATGVFALVLFSGQATAQSSGGNICPGTGNLPAAIQAVVRLLTRLQEFAVAVGVAAAALSFAYAGVLVIMGPDDPQRIQRARRTVVYTVLGLAVVLLSAGLVEVVVGIICPS